jgi:hypothetical protein
MTMPELGQNFLTREGIATEKRAQRPGHTSATANRAIFRGKLPILPRPLAT